MQTREKHYTPGQTYFVLVKGKTSTTGFYDDACFEFYLLRLLNCLHIYQVKLHAYLLQEKEIWLLLTPATPIGINSLLRHLNQSYSLYFNTRFERSIKVWSNSPVSCLIPGEKLALDSQKFIEMEPVRAKHVSHPGEYLWSSYCVNSFSSSSRYLSAHEAYRKYLRDRKNCFSQYREYIARPFTNAYYLFLASRLLCGLPLQKRRRGFLFSPAG